MLKLVIPSGDRPNKLKRTLDFYELEGIDKICDIHILDGSDGEMRHKYAELAKTYNINWHDFCGIPLAQRVNDFVNLKISADEIFILGNDEDVFLRPFIEAGEKFLLTNQDYSTFLGFYITLARPLIGFHRIPSERLCISSFDIASESEATRLNYLSLVLLAGCSPLTWGFRRGRNAKKTFYLLPRIKPNSLAEMLDQFYFALDGKIRFEQLPMIIRDETKINFHRSVEHDDGTEYISEKSFDAAMKMLASDGEFPRELFEQFYSMHKSGDGYRSIQEQTSRHFYSPYHLLGNVKKRGRGSLAANLYYFVKVLSEAFFFRGLAKKLVQNGEISLAGLARVKQRVGF